MVRAVLLVVLSLALALGLWVAQARDECQSIPGRPSVVCAGPTVGAVQDPPDSDAYCLTCHSNRSLKSHFVSGETFPLYVDVRGLRDSAHGLLTCVTCHDARRDCPPDEAETLELARYRAEAARMCTRCHLASAWGYAQSVHGEALFSTGEGATCSECHSPGMSGHTVDRLSDMTSPLASQRVDEACGRCHEQELNSYLQTSHGKMAAFGDPGSAASCTTCHGAHDTKALDDPQEPLTAARLATACGQCHRGADEEFVSAWPGHAEPSPSRSSGIYYLERTIFFSTAATLGFGLIHVSLDFLRRLAGWARK